MMNAFTEVAIANALACGMTCNEIKTEFNINCDNMDDDEVKQIHQAGKLLMHARALEAAILVDNLLKHDFKRDEVITLAAAILAKKV